MRIPRKLKKRLKKEYLRRFKANLSDHGFAQRGGAIYVHINSKGAQINFKQQVMVKGMIGETILIGLSNENIRRLKKQLPIKFNLKVLGLEDREVVIMHGTTEKAILKKLESTFNKGKKKEDENGKAD